jgi:predicted DsbA family dithiol-disulfide isomerase
MAAGEGLEIHFDRIRPGNTFNAHRVVHLAARHGRQDPMKARLMHAYFAEGALMSDHATLAALAAEVGLPADEVDDLLGTDRYTDEVRAEEELAHGFGITAVPFFVVDRAIGVPGAQEPAVLLEMLREGWRRRTEAAA